MSVQGKIQELDKIKKDLEDTRNLFNENRENIKVELQKLGWQTDQIKDLLIKLDLVKQSKQANEAVKNTPTINSLVTVECFFKPSNYINRDVIIKALVDKGFKSNISDSNDDTPINTILYGKDVSSDDVKAVAYIMIRAGISIRAIQPFATQSANRPLQIQVAAFSDPSITNADPWTSTRVENTQFPPAN